MSVADGGAIARRWLFMCWAVAPGGTLTVMRALWPRLVRFGRVAVISHAPAAVEIDQPIEIAGGRWSAPLAFPWVLVYVARMALAAYRAARRQPGTVLLPQDSLATGAAAVLAGWAARRPVVVVEHGTASQVRSNYFWEVRHPPRGRLARPRHALLRRTVMALHRLTVRGTALVLVAGAEEEEAWTAMGFPQDRMIRYRFPVDLEGFRPAGNAERSALRTRYGLPHDAVVVISVSRLAAEKGVDDIVRAIGRCHRSDLALTVVGSGPERERLEAIAPTAPHGTMFLGERSPAEVADLLRAADIFVYAGRQGANTPYAVLEAMASGLAVVATTAPAIHGLMLADGRGAAVSPGDPRALAAAIDGYAAAPDERRAAGAAARAYVEAHHAPAVLDELLDALVARLNT